ncbi:Uncharacterised protein [uncultured archaeon]|nr:Uncharacterised protein [uncultured archaeon]
MKKTNYIQTYSGILFYPLEPDPELILLPDIAHGLSNLCRYGGHCRKFYSVAQHCLMVCELLKEHAPHVQLAGLLHDATEAYLIDLPKPLKLKMPDYVEAEHRLLQAISSRFRIMEQLLEGDLVKDADKASLVIESRYLMAPLHPGFALGAVDKANDSGVSFGECLSPEEAERRYLAKFDELWLMRENHFQQEQVHR